MKFTNKKSPFPSIQSDPKPIKIIYFQVLCFSRQTQNTQNPFNAEFKKKTLKIILIGQKIYNES